jgi:hypothetical protein
VQLEIDRAAKRPEVSTLCPGSWDLMIANIPKDTMAPWLFVLIYTPPVEPRVGVAMAEWLQTTDGKKICKYGEHVWHGDPLDPN